MKDRLVVSKLAQLKLVSDPLRLRIVELLRDAALSPKQAALRLSLKPTRLYRHFQKLEAAGLIVQVSSRVRRGVTERLYRSTAKLFVVDRRLFESTGRNAERTVMRASRSMFDATVEDFESAVRCGAASLRDSKRCEIASSRISIPVSALPKLMSRLRGLLQAASQAERTPAEARTEIRLTAALFSIASVRGAPSRKVTS